MHKTFVAMGSCIMASIYLGAMDDNDLSKQCITISGMLGNNLGELIEVRDNGSAIALQPNEELFLSDIDQLDVYIPRTGQQLRTKVYAKYFYIWVVKDKNKTMGIYGYQNLHNHTNDPRLNRTAQEFFDEKLRLMKMREAFPFRGDLLFESNGKMLLQ
jgi:hypothetical protein